MQTPKFTIGTVVIWIRDEYHGMGIVKGAEAQPGATEWNYLISHKDATGGTHVLESEITLKYNPSTTLWDNP